MRKLIVGVMLILASVSTLPLRAQEKPDEAKDRRELRVRVLKRVHERLQRETERILKEVERILDEELGPAAGESASEGEGESGAAPGDPEEGRLKEAMKDALDDRIDLDSKGDAAAGAPDGTPSESVPGRGAFLGVMTSPVSATMRDMLKLKEGEGVVVQEVVPDSPAATAGLDEGDVLLKIGDASVGAPADCVRIIRGMKPGDTVALTILRKGETLPVTAVLARRPSRGEAPGSGAAGGNVEKKTDKAPSPKPGSTRFEPPREVGAKRPAPSKGELCEGIQRYLEKESTGARAPGKAEEYVHRAIEMIDSGEKIEEALRQFRAELKEKLSSPEFQKELREREQELRGMAGNLEESFRTFARDLESAVKEGEGEAGDWSRKLEDLVGKLEQRIPRLDDEIGRLSGEPETEESGRAWLGVGAAEVPESLRAQLELKEGVGALIREVSADSPAAVAGLQAGDVVTAVADQPIGDPASLQETVRSHQPGDEIVFDVLRKGKRENVRVKLGTRSR